MLLLQGSNSWQSGSCLFHDWNHCSSQGKGWHCLGRPGSAENTCSWYPTKDLVCGGKVATDGVGFRSQEMLCCVEHSTGLEQGEVEFTQLALAGSCTGKISLLNAFTFLSRKCTPCIPLPEPTCSLCIQTTDESSLVTVQPAQTKGEMEKDLCASVPQRIAFYFCSDARSGFDTEKQDPVLWSNFWRGP